HRQTVEHVLDLPADVEDQTPPGYDDLVRDAANPAHASRELCGAQSLVLPVDLAHETRPSAGDHYPIPLTARRQVAATGAEQCVHGLCSRLPTEKWLTHVEVIADSEDTVDTSRGRFRPHPLDGAAHEPGKVHPAVAHGHGNVPRADLRVQVELFPDLLPD